MPDLQAETRAMTVRLARSSGRAGRDRTASARLTQEEHRELENVAKRAGWSLSEWARETLLAAARRPADDVLLTEIVGTRLLLLNLLRPLATGKVLTEQDCVNISTQVQQNKRKVTREIQQQYVTKPAVEV